MGRGAKKMNTAVELEEYKLKHEDLMMKLPADGKRGSAKEEDKERRDRERKQERGGE